ncbi:hypothetical protein ABZ826_27360 [Streptomyces sp. NPDC047515]|uniref:hypothetical protein n=1 Tax=Streptomyces sp. NPDC047515 TaxID=3155380 RepID=UPI0033E0330A
MNPRTGLIDAYLTKQHRDTPATGCALVTLGSAAGRSDQHLKEAYESQVRTYLDLIADLDDDSEGARAGAMLTLSAVVGAMLMSRAVAGPTFSDELLTTVSDRLKHREPQPAGLPGRCAAHTCGAAGHVPSEMASRPARGPAPCWRDRLRSRHPATGGNDRDGRKDSGLGRSMSLPSEWAVAGTGRAGSPWYGRCPRHGTVRGAGRRRPEGSVPETGRPGDGSGFEQVIVPMSAGVTVRENVP